MLVSFQAGSKTVLLLAKTLPNQRRICAFTYIIEEFFVCDSQNVNDSIDVILILLFESELAAVEVPHDLLENVVTYVRYRDHLLVLALHHASLEHGSVLFTKDRHDVFVRVERLPFDHKCDIAQIGVVNHGGDAVDQGSFALRLEVPVRARVRVQLVHILQVVLSVAASDNVQFGADEGHRVTCSHLRVLLRIREVVAVGPRSCRWFKHVQVVEALGVGS